MKALPGNWKEITTNAIRDRVIPDAAEWCISRLDHPDMEEAAFQILRAAKGAMDKCRAEYPAAVKKTKKECVSRERKGKKYPFISFFRGFENLPPGEFPGVLVEALMNCYAAMHHNRPPLLVADPAESRRIAQMARDVADFIKKWTEAYRTMTPDKERPTLPHQFNPPVMDGLRKMIYGVNIPIDELPLTLRGIARWIDREAEKAEDKTMPRKVLGGYYEYESGVLLKMSPGEGGRRPETSEWSIAWNLTGLFRRQLRRPLHGVTATLLSAATGRKYSRRSVQQIILRITKAEAIINSIA